MQTSLVLSQRVSSNSKKKMVEIRESSGGVDFLNSLVNESLQSRASVLDEVLLKYPVVTPEGKLSFHCLAR